MFRLYFLRKKLAREDKEFELRINEALQNKTFQQQTAAFDERSESLERLHKLISHEMTRRLLQTAAHYDIEEPVADEDDFWYTDPKWSRCLTPTGRFHLRKLIDEEKTRRREVKAWWWKTIILPALTSGIGIIGALTGLVAVLKKH
jgi:hypothetical protein